VQNPVDKDSLCMTLEIDPMITASKTVKGPSITLNFSKTLSLERIQIFGKDLKLGEQVELQMLRKSTHLRGAGWVKNDLEHVNRLAGNFPDAQRIALAYLRVSFLKLAAFRESKTVDSCS